MPTKVNILAPFRRDLRRLAKKYPAVLTEFETLAQQLKADARPAIKFHELIGIFIKFGWQIPLQTVVKVVVSA